VIMLAPTCPANARHQVTAARFMKDRAEEPDPAGCYSAKTPN
jgi:hypothetical protein